MSRRSVLIGVLLLAVAMALAKADPSPPHWPEQFSADFSVFYAPMGTRHSLSSSDSMLVDREICGVDRRRGRGAFLPLLVHNDRRLVASPHHAPPLCSQDRTGRPRWVATSPTRTPSGRCGRFTTAGVPRYVLCSQADMFVTVMAMVLARDRVLARFVP